MTDRIELMLRDGAAVLAEGTALAPASELFAQGRRRRNRRRTAAVAGLATVAAAAVAFVPGLVTGAGPGTGQLASGTEPSPGTVPSGSFAVVVETAGTPGPERDGPISRCVDAAGGTARPGSTPTTTTYLVSSSTAAGEVSRCVSRLAGVSHVTFVPGDAAPAAASFTYDDLPAAVPGTLRDTGIDNFQTWIADEHDGTGMHLCWGQADPFEHACADRAPYPGFGPPSEDPRSRLIGGTVATDATAGYVLARGQRLRAAVEHYDQFPGVAVVLARWPGEHVTGSDFGPTQFLPVA